MLSSFFKHRILFLLLTALFVCGAPLASAQTTEFTYQGNLVDNSIPANGNYDFEFRLFAVSTDGTPIGTRTRLNVPVTHGGFTVRLDFLPAAFNGADRFLEITVKPAGSPNPFTMLSPRQQLTYAPYSFHSLNAETADTATTATTATNATQLGGVAANQYVLTSDSRLSDARPPTGGSPNYVQNNPVQQQPANFNINGNGIIGGNLTVNGLLNASLPPDDSSYIQNNISQQSGIVSFNISGNGTLGGTLSANTVSATTQYNIAGVRVLSIVGTDNTFVGRAAGTNNTGAGNSFFGRNAGNANTDGYSNSFFGNDAGLNNGGGHSNSFFGDSAGQSNSMGSANSFFGEGAGKLNTTGGSNSFFGESAGQSNSTGFFNSFFGSDAGFFNTMGFQNTFVGYAAGRSNTLNDNNSFFGYEAGKDNNGGGQNSFFGSMSGSLNEYGYNNSFFGHSAGRLNRSGIYNSFFGEGAGESNYSGNSNTFVGQEAGKNTTDGSANTFIGRSAGVGNSTGDYNTTIGADANVGSGGLLTHATAIGAESFVSSINTIALGRSDGSDTVLVYGKLQINTLGTSGTTQLCLNGSNRIADCQVSSLRYKTNVQTLTGGLDIVRRLRPITFNWKDGGMKDVGFAAEEVEQIEPLLATYKGGQTQGVKYAQITTVLVNAVKEQQQQIAAQQKQIQELKSIKAENAQLKAQLAAIFVRLDHVERKRAKRK